MKLRRALLVAITSAAALGAGGVIASALNDLPQDARPVQDPTAELNSQPAAQPPTPPVVVPPREPAPEAAPAPIVPIPITPPSPSVVVVPEAEDVLPTDEEADAEQAEAVAAPAEAEKAAEPVRRQRRRVAIVEAVDKITAETMRFAVEVGGRPVRFADSLIVSARACEVSTPEELVPDAIAYLEFRVQPRGLLQASEPREIFRGWMFASSPGVNGLQHPIYDAWVVGCRA
jgi:hypothetical protein